MSPGEVFLLFVRHLEKNNIPYAVLGDVTSYPFEIHSDIDIILLPQDYANCVDLIREFADYARVRPVQLLQHEFCASCFILVWKGENQELSYISLDICSDFYLNGRPLLKAADLLENQKSKAGKKADSTFKTLSSEKEFIYYFVKKVDKGSISTSHFRHLQKQFFIRPELCIEELRRFWSLETANTIGVWLINSSIVELKQAISDLKKRLRKKTNPSLRDIGQELQRRLKRIIQPTGLVIALLGPDGCGKSTVSDRLHKDLSPIFRGIRRFHLRPHFFRKNTDKHNAPVFNPHAQAPRNAVTSVLKLFYFLSDYLLGFIFIVFPLKVRSNLIIFDRYFHDLMIDPKRYRYKAPGRLAAIIGYLIPKPDIFLVLDAPAEIVQSRKKEVPFSETERQCKAYADFTKWGARHHVLNTNRTTEETAAEAEDVIIEFISRRFNTRMT